MNVKLKIILNNMDKHEFIEVSVCPHCDAIAEERWIGDEGFTFCSEDCGCLEGQDKVRKFECQECFELYDDEECNCELKN